MPSVLITGTSTGIGNEAALHLARAGYEVYATMRTPANNQNLLEAAAKESLKLQVLQHDVTDTASNKAVVEAVTKAAGQIDILINNAGIGGAGPIEETPMADFRAVFDTNFFGVIELTQLVLPQMRERRSGCIVNITSVAGRMSVSPQGAYSSSKVALESVSEMLAQEVTPFNIRVANIEPGIIITPILEKFSPPTATHYMQQFERMGVFFEAGLKAGAMPSLVAEAIQNAIETDTPRLQYLVGNDANGIMKMHAELSKDEWIALFGEPKPLKEWVEEIAGLTGLPL